MGWLWWKPEDSSMHFRGKPLQSSAWLAIVSLIVASMASPTVPATSTESPPYVVSEQDRNFLLDVERRSALFFWEQADSNTGLVLDRANADGGVAKGPDRDIASSAATGFGLTALCVAAEHGWLTRDQARERVRVTLHFFMSRAYQNHGWFYHWMEVSNGDQKWNSEVSSIDTALLLGGVLTAGQYFSGDDEIATLAHDIYDRVDFQWMLAGDPLVLSHGWRNKNFLKYRWDTYAEASALYLLAIGSRTHPIPSESWYAWQRPLYTYGPYQFISGGPLFTHQFAHAWVDFRERRDEGFIDFFRNSVKATRANQLYCLNVKNLFPLSFVPNVWGITASDSPKGYKIYGELEQFVPVDGTVAPCAAGGSLMFTPDISVPALRTIHERYGDKVYRRYGFVDSYNAASNWFDTDVIGIDQGILLLSAENLLTGNVWKWFMADGAASRGMELAGFSPPPSAAAAPVKKKMPSKRKKRVKPPGKSSSPPAGSLHSA
jgi:hypothetical protein